MSPSTPTRTGSGVAWIDRKVDELRGARLHLEGLGMAPTAINDAGGGHRFQSVRTGWKVPHWIGTFTDDQLIDMARERGFGG